MTDVRRAHQSQRHNLDGGTRQKPQLVAPHQLARKRVRLCCVCRWRRRRARGRHTSGSGGARSGALRAMLLQAVEHVVGRSVDERRECEDGVDGVAKNGDVTQRIAFDACDKRVVDVEHGDVVQRNLDHVHGASRHLIKQIYIVQYAVLVVHFVLKHASMLVVNCFGAVGASRAAASTKVLKKILCFFFFFAKFTRKKRWTTSSRCKCHRWTSL
jgi:hypothetical protein